MRVCVLLVVLCALGASATDQTQKTMANVVYTQPHLNYDELSEVIHPYAWSSQMPTPYYDDKLNAYDLSDKALEQFLEVQTHIKADSSAARSLVEVASTTEQHARKGIFGAIGRGLKRGVKAVGRGIKRGVKAVGRGIKRLFGRRSAPYANPKGFSTVMRHSLVNNPATYRINKLKPVPSDFLKNPRQKYATGSFPGSQHYRRGTYGLRRRRIPYYSKKEGFGSANPFRRSNNFFNSPGDAMLPKTDKRSPYYAATHPGAFDIGATAPSGGLPYGGFSSFRHNRFRSARNQAAQEGGAFFGGVSSPSMPGANTQFLSDGSPNPFRAEDVVKHTHPGAAPQPPNLGAPSPFVSGDNTFRDFYGGGGAGGESAAAEF